MACFRFVPAQCSSVKPWNRWSLLRRLFPRQKSSVRAQAGSLFQCNGYRSLLKITPAAFPWSALCFKDALVLLGWGLNCQTWKSTFNSIFSVQSSTQYCFLHGAWSGTPGDDYTLPFLRLPRGNWCPENEKFLHKDQQNYCYEAYGSGWDSWVCAHGCGSMLSDQRQTWIVTNGVSPPAGLSYTNEKSLLCR